jgi:hypothetical protein
MDVNVILQVATLAVVTVGGYLLRLGKTGLEEGVKASAKKGPRSRSRTTTGRRS